MILGTSLLPTYSDSRPGFMTLYPKPQAGCFRLKGWTSQSLISGFLRNVDKVCVAFYVSWSLKMWSIVCPETSVTIYHYKLGNNPEEGRSHYSHCSTCSWRTHCWCQWTDCMLHSVVTVSEAAPSDGRLMIGGDLKRVWKENVFLPR